MVSKAPVVLVYLHL